MPLIANSLKNLSTVLIAAALIIAAIVLGRDILVPPACTALALCQDAGFELASLWKRSAPRTVRRSELLSGDTTRVGREQISSRTVLRKMETNMAVNKPVGDMGQREKGCGAEAFAAQDRDRGWKSTGRSVAAPGPTAPVF